MLIYLQVEYKDRRKAKLAGAKWDPLKRRWCVDDTDLKRFLYSFSMRKEREAKSVKHHWVQLELKALD